VISDFISGFFSSFIGAGMAFVFGLWMYHYQNKLNNAYYLSFCLTTLSDITSELYKIKKDVVSVRLPYLNQLNSDLRTRAETLSLGHLTLHIFYNSNLKPFDIEKLAFLVQYNPNLISLLRNVLDSFSNTIGILNECNLAAEKFRNDPNQENLMMLMSVNSSLSQQVDSSLYLAEKSFEVLLKYSQTFFRGYISITGTELIESDLKELKPTPIPSWERYNWDPPKVYSWYSPLGIQKRLKNLINYFQDT